LVNCDQTKEVPHKKLIYAKAQYQQHVRAIEIKFRKEMKTYENQENNNFDEWQKKRKLRKIPFS